MMIMRIRLDTAKQVFQVHASMRMRKRLFVVSFGAARWGFGCRPS
jgi:hypothetical protein